MDFHQTFFASVSWDLDELISFVGQRVTVQDHVMTIYGKSTIMGVAQ